MHKSLNTLALSSFVIPGDPTFPLGALFAAPSERQETDLLRQYITQLRQETVLRLMDRVYQGDQVPSKWWMMFSKRKFMGKSF
ncbi:subunit of the Arp2/3 complex [Entomophthora muscae]|uniref:Subunit of the Arp2/3 complex n=1 Tax=Entomophthora muscae TaxID=34485 RepID=A0ACC2SZ92_9FUNG|nr:subunit of the Arp2/3 complex [Entomophthora muscae]